jgi:hypothetical protein
MTAACILLNMIRNERIPYPNEDTSLKEHNLHVSNENLLPLTGIGGNATNEAFRLRDSFENYCSTDGTLRRQLKHVTRTS